MRSCRSADIHALRSATCKPKRQKRDLRHLPHGFLPRFSRLAKSVLILYIKWVHQPSGQERNLSLVEAIFSTFPTQNESLTGKSEDTFGVEHDYEGGDVGEFDFSFWFSSEIGSRSRSVLLESTQTPRHSLYLAEVPIQKCAQIFPEFNSF